MWILYNVHFQLACNYRIYLLGRCLVAGEDEFYYIFLYFYRYNSTTCTFTVPIGGDGYYFFSAYFALQAHHNGVFQLRINEENICTVIIYTVHSDDFGQSSCSGVVYAEEGKMLQYPLTNVHPLKRMTVNFIYIYKFRKIVVYLVVYQNLMVIIFWMNCFLWL